MYLDQETRGGKMLCIYSDVKGCKTDAGGKIIVLCEGNDEAELRQAHP
jgi:hypothetical protein